MIISDLLNLELFQTFSVIIFVGLSIYTWRRRWLYYHASKIPGPFALPILGSIHLVTEGPHGIYKVITKLFHDYPTTVKIWLGPYLYVSTTDPKHLKVLLTRFLDKGNFYHLMSEYFQRALAAAPVELWRKNRKNVNPTFNVTLIGSFLDSFVKHANLLTDSFENKCGKETDDIFGPIWKCTLDAGCETLGEVDSSLIHTEKYLEGIYRIEEILMERFFTPVLHLDIFWKFSSKRKELIEIWKQNCSCIKEMMKLMQPLPIPEPENMDENQPMKKRFLRHLVDLNRNNEVPMDYIPEEAQIMFFVGTETSAVALSSTMLVLGMYQDVQKKIHDELDSIFAGSDRDPTPEDVSKMEYLERVLKETLRLLPPIPFVMRTVEEDIQLGEYVFPKGASILIPIAVVHKKPEFWPDPLKFDPDRFLPEEVEKRPPCSYLPFSYGVRNCIGYKYGLLSMKVILSSLLRRYRIRSSNYNSIEEIDLFIHVVAKAKNGYKVTLEKRE